MLAADTFEGRACAHDGCRCGVCATAALLLAMAALVCYIYLGIGRCGAISVVLCTFVFSAAIVAALGTQRFNATNHTCLSVHQTTTTAKYVLLDDIWLNSCVALLLSRLVFSAANTAVQLSAPSLAIPCDNRAAKRRTERDNGSKVHSDGLFGRSCIFSARHLCHYAAKAYKIHALKN
jgi:hypothetical protein